MTAKKISQLPVATPLLGAELLAALQNGGDVAVTPAQVATYVGVLPSRLVAQNTSITSTVGTLTTQGYYASGDGGGANYERTNADPGHAYSLQTSDGQWWVYVPEAHGWNAKVAGVKADGVTDDTVALQNALVPFNSANFGIAGGKGLTGRLILPAGQMVITRPIVYCGENTNGIHILGQQVGSFGTGGTTILWQGTLANSYASAIYLRSANRCIVEGIKVYGGFNNGLINCIAIMSDQISTTLTAGVSSGLQTVTPAAMTFITAGTYIGVGSGTANFEVVLVIATTGSTFTAMFINSHGLGETVGGGPPSAGNVIRDCSFYAPGPITLPATTSSTNTITFASLPKNLLPGVIVTDVTSAAKIPWATKVTAVDYSTGIITVSANVTVSPSDNIKFSQGVGVFCGNTYNGTTPQVSEVKLVNLAVNVITGVGGDMYAGINIVGSGNVCNYSISRCSIVGGQYAVVYFGGPFCRIEDCPTGATIIAEFNAANVYIDSCEVESTGARFLTGSGGFATVSNCYYNTATYPTDGYAIAYASGNLTLIGNHFGTGAICKIQAGGGPTTITGINPYQVTSIGNLFASAGPTIPVFYDGSNNALSVTSDFAASRKTRLYSIGDYGDNGQLYATTGQLTSIQGGVSLASLVAGTTVLGVNEIGMTTSVVTVPFSVFQTAGLTKQVTLFNLPAKTRIVGVIADVTAAFGGTAGTLNLSAEVSSTGDILTAFDCKTGTVTKGLAATDLGSNLTTAANLPPGGYFPSWSAQTAVKCTLVSGTGNLSGLTVGSVNIYVTVSRFNPS